MDDEELENVPNLGECVLDEYGHEVEYNLKSYNFVGVKIPIPVALAAAQILFEIMREADSDGFAQEIRLGPQVVREMRDLMVRIAAEN